MDNAVTDGFLQKVTEWSNSEIELEFEENLQMVDHGVAGGCCIVRKVDGMSQLPIVHEKLGPVYNNDWRTKHSAEALRVIHGWWDYPEIPSVDETGKIRCKILIPSDNPHEFTRPYQLCPSIMADSKTHTSAFRLKEVLAHEYAHLCVALFISFKDIDMKRQHSTHGRRNHHGIEFLVM
ncbi:hypothetical protein H072_5459 [Dactylellina haptotyla CBS 200.50]|uniref:Uncharacterized protein n=1 Tax=Dactylellina haptotyla (strain CBS 200.50) TaxID=1284197 RepID=S8AHJ9_DACHA|nr:hypothetical protein H072_5459 [Dactylellina haptotyla CBS 200.50]